MVTSFTKFKKLGQEFREMQLQLLSTACPESMDLKGLMQWGNLAAQTVAYAYKVQDDASHEQALRDHWGALKDNAVAQLERVSATMVDYIETAEELTAWERCKLVELAGTVSRTFQDESDAILRVMAEEGSANQVPDTVSLETLSRLSQL